MCKRRDGKAPTKSQNFHLSSRAQTKICMISHRIDRTAIRWIIYNVYHSTVEQQKCRISNRLATPTMTSWEKSFYFCFTSLGAHFNSSGNTKLSSNFLNFYLSVDNDENLNRDKNENWFKLRLQFNLFKWRIYGNLWRAMKKFSDANWEELSGTKTVSNDFMFESGLSARDFAAINFVLSIVQHCVAIETELHSESEVKYPLLKLLRKFGFVSLSRESRGETLCLGCLS